MEGVKSFMKIIKIAQDFMQRFIRFDKDARIEIFIDDPRNKENGNNKRLIAFIKGETDVLKLK